MLLRGAARLLHQELSYFVTLFRVAHERGTVWATGVEQPSQLTAGERRTLARRLSAEQWDTIITAQHRVTTVTLSRGLMDEKGFFTLTDEHSGLKTTLPLAIQALDRARDVLHAVAEPAAEPSAE